MIKNLDKYKKVRDVNLTIDNLIDFESDIVEHWEAGNIKAPVHLSNGNEKQIIEKQIFRYLSFSAFAFSASNFCSFILLNSLILLSISFLINLN